MKLHALGFFFVILPVYCLNYATGFTSSSGLLLEWLQSNVAQAFEHSNPSVITSKALSQRGPKRKLPVLKLTKHKKPSKNKSQGMGGAQELASNENQANEMNYPDKKDDILVASKGHESSSLFNQTSLELNEDILEAIFSRYYPQDPSLKQYVSQFDCAAYIFYENHDGTLLCMDDLEKLSYCHNNIKFSEYIVEGATLVEVGLSDPMQILTTSKLVGPLGSVHAFESDVKLFCETAINLHFNQCKNVILHRNFIGKDDLADGSNDFRAKVADLDDFQFNHISLMTLNNCGIKIETLFSSAKETILKNQPFLIFKGSKIKSLKKFGYVHIASEDDAHLFGPK